DEPITALFDLLVDDIDDVRGAREAVDQTGEHSADGGCGDWQSVGAHGRILLDRPRQGVARHLNDHLLLASKWVFRHAISSNRVRHAIKVSARPRKSPPKPKVQRVSGPVILPNRAYATLPVAGRERTAKIVAQLELSHTRQRHASSKIRCSLARRART